MKRLLFIILSCTFLLTGCGGASNNNKTSNTTTNGAVSEKKTVYEDIKLRSIVIPKEANAELRYSTDVSVEFVVNKKSVICLQFADSNSTYEEEAKKEYIRSVSSLIDSNVADLSAINVELTDKTSSIFELYKASYNSECEYYGFGEYKGYIYLAQLKGIYDSKHPSLPISFSETDAAPYYEDFKNVLDMAQIPESTNETKSSTYTTKKVTTQLDTTTIGQKNALRQAQNYIDLMPFSYSGMIEQLEYEGYSHEEATYGADHCGADWYDQAAKKAQSYLDLMAFSKERLIEQLEYDGFTHAQAEYGAQTVGY